MGRQHRISVRRACCACAIVACVLVLPGCGLQAQRSAAADHSVPYGTYPATPALAGAGAQAARGSRAAIPAPTIVIPVQGSRLALQGSAIPLGQRSSGAPMLVLLQPPPPRPQVPPAPPRSDAWLPQPADRYAALAPARAAAAPLRNEARPIPASFSVPVTAPTSPAISAPIKVPVNAPIAAPISPPFQSAYTPGLRGFGEAETAAVVYAGGPCSKDIYHLAWNAADLFDVQPVTIAALIEVESRCRNDAVSDVGARGLMQLMPATGARAAYRYLHGTDHQPTLAELYDPATNIQLGAAYVGLLQTHYKFIASPRTRQVLVVAAYNCGPDFIDQRLPQQAYSWNEIQALDWVHRNTPEETRGFVDSVLQKAETYGSAASIARAAASFTSGKNLSP